jgi:hypothetical protein
MFPSPGKPFPPDTTEIAAPPIARRTRIAPTVLMLVSAALVIAALLLLGRLERCPWSSLCGPLLADDANQGRLDTALPAPQAGLRLEQTFIPHHDGLTEVEVILVQYGGSMPEGSAESFFSLELLDEVGAAVASVSLPTRQLSHNQVYALRFPPQRASAGRRYTLRLSGSEQNHISAWGYALDVYEAGDLRLTDGTGTAELPELTARELRFVARYALTPGEAVAAAALPLREWLLTLAALLFLPLPGVLLLLLIRPRGWDPAAWLGAALALGVAAWPIVWLWFSLAGGRWTGPLLWVVVAGGWLAALLCAIVDRRKRGGVGGRQRRGAGGQGSRGDDHEAALAARLVQPPQPTDLLNTDPLDTDDSPLRFRRPSSIVILLLATLLLATSTRFIAVRDLAFPPWVDSSRHALITAVMVENGRAPGDYQPFLRVDHFPYHFGFHTLSASLELMTGRPLPGLLLHLMQLLGGLLPLTVYAAGWMVTRRPAVGLLAAFLVALPFFFPGYYATWGRMTQLTAMLIMPPLLALTWRLGRGWPRIWPLVGVLAAGLFLIHFRVFLFYLPFAVLAAVAHWFSYRRWRGLAGAAALGTALVLPRLIELLTVTDPLRTFQQSLPGYNDFPTGYFTSGWERLFLALAAAGIAILVVGIALRRRWAAFPTLLVLWVGALFALLAGDRLGLPETLVVNLNSMVITLFLPLALFLAIIAGRVWSVVSGQWSVVSGRRSFVCGLSSVMAGLALGLLALFGWRLQANILNPQTILAWPEDADALVWSEANVPADARVAVNAWQWLGVTWAAADGGAWITPLTGRTTTTPPIDYIYNRELFAAVRAFNEAASAIEDWADPAVADWLAAQGVSHVFVGARGGYFDPAELSRNPGLRLVYQHDGAFIFALEQ